MFIVIDRKLLHPDALFRSLLNILQSLVLDQTELSTINKVPEAHMRYPNTSCTINNAACMQSKLLGIILMYN